MHPRLFTSLILLEPVFDRSIHECQGPTLARASTFRRDVWDSMEEAEIAARKSKKGWDERVIKKWMEHGYRAVPDSESADSTARKAQNGSFDAYAWLKERELDGSSNPQSNHTGRTTQSVTLKTSKHQEVFSYLRPNFGAIPVAGAGNHTTKSDQDMVTARARNDMADIIGPADAITPFYRAEPVIAHTFLPHLRPPVLYIFGAKSPLATSALRHAKLERTGVGISGSGGAKQGRVKELVVPEATHLLPLEKVEECAEAIAVWLGDEVGRWVVEEEKMREEWDGKTMREKTSLSKEWEERVRSML